MKQHPFSITHTELFLLYNELKDRIRTRLAEFKAVPQSQYIYELFYCLLTPQSHAHHAAVVVQKLQERNFATYPFNPEPLLREPAHYIRFHKTKARYLLLAQEQSGIILQAINTLSSAIELRSFLVKTVRGFGYKETTHFLRNIGRNGSCAILDRHILRMLHHFEVLPHLPTSLSPKKYEEIETRFQIFARHIGIPINELDLLFWYIGTGELLK